jgi:multidrug efflux pump subunit AcrB
VVNEYADTFIAPRISMISGVAQVLIYGSQKYAVRIQLDPQALATRGIGIDEVSNAVQRNVNLLQVLYFHSGHLTGQWSIDGGRSLPTSDCGLPARFTRAPPGDWESDQ